MTDTNDNVTLAHAITIAWLSNPHTHVSADAAATFLRNTYTAVTNLAATGEVVAALPVANTEGEYIPAVSVRKSLANPDFVISLIDGRPYRTLGRHLRSHGITPDEYRRRYNLKGDYPLVAPGYRKARSEQALQLGLGRKPAIAIEKAMDGVSKPVKAVGSGLVDHSQKMTVAARATAEKKAVGQRS